MEAIPTWLTDRLLMLSVALLLSALWPARLRGGAARALSGVLLRLATKLNRQRRSVATRVWRGLVLVGFAGGVAALFGVAVASLSVLHVRLELLEIVLLAYLLPLRAIRDEAAMLSQASGEMPAQRRTALEHVATDWNGRMVAPAMYYVALGPAGLCAVRVINVLAGLIGHSSQQWLAFGWAAGRLNALLFWLPVRMAALLFVLAAAFVPKGAVLSAMKSAFAAPGRLAPLAVMAGALRISLGGPAYGGWVGPGSAKLSAGDLRRGLLLYIVAALLLWLLCVLALALLSDIAIIPTPAVGEGE